MFNNIRKFVFICLIFVLTGCSVEYDLTINEDNSINEKVIASENINKLESLTKKKSDQAVTYLFNMYKKKNENIKLVSQEKRNTIYGIATTQHSDIDEYATKFKSDVFNKVNVTRNNNIVTFIANQESKLGNDDNYSLIYDNIKINIYIPYKVIEHNADSVQGNIYTWEISKNQDLKTIKFSYSEDALKEKINLNINNKMYNINYAIIAISGIILVLLIITIIVAIKNSKNNSF